MCVNLSDELLYISNQFVDNYKVFIMVDNNSQDLSQFKIPNNMKVLRIDDEKCVKLGYKNANATLKKIQFVGIKYFIISVILIQITKMFGL